MAGSSLLKTNNKRKKQKDNNKDSTTIISASISSPSPSSPPHSPNDNPTPMNSSPRPTYSGYPLSYTKFNSALNAGLLNPMSPPPHIDNTRSSPTLFDMMSNEQDYTNNPRSNPNPNMPHNLLINRPQDRQMLLQERINDILGSVSPRSLFNDLDSSDVKLTLSSKDGFSFSLNVHRQILVENSRFFAGKLSDRWSKQQKSLPHLIEISDCDDVDVYVETLRLMYCKDMRRKLIKEDVSRVLDILKVCASIDFDAGVLACLEYLEAAPWAEDEEEKVASLLSQLKIESSSAGEVLKRVSVEAPIQLDNGVNNGGEEILARLLQVVLDGKDEKARREMKGLVAKMLRENNGKDISKESLYSASNNCLQLLHYHFIRVASSDTSEAVQIARQADNLRWILDILVDRRIADEFLRTWASQTDLSGLHSKIQAMYRYEVSNVTARLFVGIGKGQVLVSKETRSMLLKTWLDPFYEDFGWMRRACKGLDRHSIEDGLGNTILTLPMGMQQEIFLAWFDRFLNSGDDCPNIQRGFEVWWRRAFWKRNGEQERAVQLRIAAVCDNS